jgi:hypothetical protein
MQANAKMTYIMIIYKVFHISWTDMVHLPCDVPLPEQGLNTQNEQGSHTAQVE